VDKRECIVSDAVVKYLNIDPKSRAEIHISLCNKYLSDAEARISEDDYVQASEKGWVPPRRRLKQWLKRCKGVHE